MVREDFRKVRAKYPHKDGQIRIRIEVLVQILNIVANVSLHGIFCLEMSLKEFDDRLKRPEIRVSTRSGFSAPTWHVLTFKT